MIKNFSENALTSSLKKLLRKKERRKKTMEKMNLPNVTLNELTLDDLNISDVRIDALQKEESMGVPELGASFSLVACSTVTSITL
jgi:hypothetical protein